MLTVLFGSILNGSYFSGDLLELFKIDFAHFINLVAYLSVGDGCSVLTPLVNRVSFVHHAALYIAFSPGIESSHLEVV